MDIVVIQKLYILMIVQFCPVLYVYYLGDIPKLYQNICHPKVTPASPSILRRGDFLSNIETKVDLVL